MTADQAAQFSAASVQTAFSSGDIASLILTTGTFDEAAFQRAIEPLVPVIQNLGIAVIIQDSSRVAGRVGADGLQLGQDPGEIRQAMEKFSPRLMVGSGNVKTRHNALIIGELQPDYLMFGKPGGDIREDPHPKNLDLGAWWSAIVEIPCIVMGGTALESAVTVARTGVEFVAMGNAIFMPQDEATTGKMVEPGEIADRIRKINALLDKDAPRFEQIDD